jgi:hypothetical protein
MKKSELKKRLIEALTPDEAAKVEPKYKETYAAMIKGKGPLKLKKYDNPDKVVRGRVVNTIKNESLKIAEKLGKTADVGDYKDDFRKSDAPQFKGKSKKKRDQMATAAFLNKEDLDVGHQDDEPRMIKKDIYNMGKYAMEIYKKLDQYDDMEGEVDFPHWWQSKITKAKSMLQSAYDYLDGEERISQIDAIMQEEVTDKEENKLKKIKKELNKASKMHKGQADRISKIVDEDAKDKSEENYSNYFKKMDKNRLEELVKAALMGPISEKKFPDLNDDGKITKADVLIGRGVKLEGEANEDKDFIQKAIKRPGALRKKLGVKKGEDIPKGKINKAIAKLKKKDKDDEKEGTQLGAADERELKQLNLAKTLSKLKEESLSERILKELRGGINEMAGEDLELKSLAKKIIPTLKRSGFEVEYSTDTSMKTLKNAGDKFLALRVQDGMLGVHIPFREGLDAAKEVQKLIQKYLGNEFEYKLSKSKRGPGFEYYTILIRNK